MNYKKRLKSLNEKISESGLDAFFVTDLLNVRYLTGFTGSSANCIINENEPAFFTDTRYRIQAKREVDTCEIFDKPGSLDAFLGSISEKRKLRIGVEGEHLSCERYINLKERYPTVEFVLIKSFVESLRAIKDDDELRLIKNAIEIAEDGFLNAVSYIKPNRTERDIALKLEMIMRENGSEEVPFQIIAAAGKRSAMPHAGVSRNRIKNGDMVVVDFGARSGGYCSDMTRTVIIGKPEGRKKEMFDLVLEARKEVFRHTRPGMTCGEVDALARNCIASGGWEEFFLHGTGHGVGLNVHERPVVGKDRDEILVQGMVFTVEPGLYHPDVGGVRIEDMVYMGKDSVEVITKLPVFFME